MPSGIRWWPMFRVTPTDGAGWTFDTRTDLATPAGVMSIQGPVYRLAQDLLEDITRQLQPRNFGWRCELVMEYAVTQDMTDHDAWIRLINALFDRDHYTVELSLDQGQTYRVVDMIGDATETNPSNKTAAGIIGRLSLRCRELITERVPLASVVDQDGFSCGW